MGGSSVAVSNGLGETVLESQAQGACVAARLRVMGRFPAARAGVRRVPCLEPVRQTVHSPPAFSWQLEKDVQQRGLRSRQEQEQELGLGPAQELVPELVPLSEQA